MGRRTALETHVRREYIDGAASLEDTVPGKMYRMAEAGANFDLMVKEVKRKALLDAAKEIRDHLDPDEVSKAQQGRMNYAIGFLEASADEYKEIR